MKVAIRSSLLLLLSLLVAGPPLQAQQKTALSASSTDCSTAGSCLSIGLYETAQNGQTQQRYGGVTITVGANASGNTLQFEASGDAGSTWVALNATPSNSTTAATSTTSTGVWQANVAGYTNVRVRMSTLAGGTATVSIVTSTASARAGGGGGGGGSGTVTSVSGTANQIDVATGTTTPVLSLDAAFTGANPATGTQFAIKDWATTSTEGAACPPPLTVGTFTLEYVLASAAAVQATCPQVGLVARTDVATSGSPIVAADTAAGDVVYAAATAAAVTVPTPTTLANSNPIFATDNNLTTGAITFTPTTLTVNGGATLVQNQKQHCLWFINPALSTDWFTQCMDRAGFINGLAVPTSATGIATNSSGQPVQQTSANILAICTTCVATGQTNVYGAFLQDFTSGTMEIPEAAGFTTNVNSTIGQDTTANAPHIWANSADALIASEAAGIVANTVTKSTDATHGLITASSMIDNGTNVTSTDTGGYIAPVFVSNGTTAGFADFPQGTTSAAVAPCNVATSICWQAPTSVTSYLGVFPGAAATGFPFWTNAANVVTESIITMAAGTMPAATSASAAAFTTTPVLGVAGTSNGTLTLSSSGNASGLTVLTPGAATSTVNMTYPIVSGTLCASGSACSATTLTSTVALGTAPLTVTSATPVANLQPAFLRATMTADWTCGTGGTVSSCVAATIVGSTGVPMTITLPLSALSWDFDCDGVATDTTGTPANNWNLLTATNGATNVTAYYMMGTASAVGGFGATTDQASTTTTFSIGGTWTLGAAGTKFPFHIHARIEGASASGTVVSLQIVDPTIGDLLTIYRGMSCWAHQ